MWSPRIHPQRANAALPLPLVTITFDQDMFAGDPSDSSSVRDLANYSLEAATADDAQILAANYDPQTRTVLLSVAGIQPDAYVLTVRAQA